MSDSYFPTLVMTDPAATTHQPLASPNAVTLDVIEVHIPPTAESAAAWIAGEAQALTYLARVAANQDQPGELAARLGLHNLPKPAGFLARIEKVLRATVAGNDVSNEGTR